MRFLLDTDAASYIIKRHPPEFLERLRQIPPTQVCLSAVTRAELLYGLKRLPQSHRLHQVVQAFLDLAQVLPWPASAADWYADIRHQLTTEGQPIGNMDMMIAAHALAIGATLVTNNARHYSRIRAPLVLENWANNPASLSSPNQR